MKAWLTTSLAYWTNRYRIALKLERRYAKAGNRRRERAWRRRRIARRTKMYARRKALAELRDEPRTYRPDLPMSNEFGSIGTLRASTVHYSAGGRAKNAQEGIALTRAFNSLHRDKGWGAISYWLVIPDDGSIVLGRPARWKGAHVYLHNTGNLGINFPGTTGDQPTDAQRATYRWLMENAHKRLPVSHRPTRKLSRLMRRGHNQWPSNATGCPGLYIDLVR